MKVAFMFMQYEAHFMIFLSGTSCLQSVTKLLTNVINWKPPPSLLIVHSYFPLLLDLDRQ
jgi:hypothetical protein